MCKYTWPIKLDLIQLNVTVHEVEPAFGSTKRNKQKSQKTWDD